MFSRPPTTPSPLTETGLRGRPAASGTSGHQDSCSNILRGSSASVKRPPSAQRSSRLGGPARPRGQTPPTGRPCAPRSTSRCEAHCGRQRACNRGNGTGAVLEPPRTPGRAGDKARHRAGGYGTGGPSRVLAEAAPGAAPSRRSTRPRPRRAAPRPTRGHATCHWPCRSPQPSWASRRPTPARAPSARGRAAASPSEGRRAAGAGRDVCACARGGRRWPRPAPPLRRGRRLPGGGSKTPCCSGPAPASRSGKASRRQRWGAGRRPCHDLNTQQVGSLCLPGPLSLVGRSDGSERPGGHQVRCLLAPAANVGCRRSPAGGRRAPCCLSPGYIPAMRAAPVLCQTLTISQC